MRDILEGLKVIDVDTHALEPPDLWTSRISPTWGDAIPRVVPDPVTGLPRWKVADVLLTGVATHSAAGWGDWYPSRPPTFEEADPGSWDPKERLKRMDEYGVYTQILYPNQIGFHIHAFMRLDPALRLQCVQAYNDYQAEFCATDPKRLVALVYPPFWDLDESIKEIERCTATGYFKGVNWGTRFERLGFQPFRDEHWDPLYALAQEIGHPLNFHIGFNQQTVEETSLISVRDRLESAKFSGLLFAGNIEGIAEVIFSGVCDRFPSLNFVSVESGYGYVPFLLQMLDWQFANYGQKRYYPTMLKPSEYFRRQIYATFWFEELAVSIDQYPDNVMFESDYPHGTSLSPGPASEALTAADTLRKNLDTVPQDIINKIVQDNAVRVYNLDI